MFAQCDKNNDGYICYEDIATCLQEKNVPYLEVEIIYFLEKNKAGLDEKLDYSEFKRALKRN
jgi:Ca2+-binding EF-hand superfamily protein